MKHFLKLTVAVILVCQSHCYSQENSKRISLKVKDLKTVEKNGKTSWTVKTILINHSHDTLYYLSLANCENAYYAVAAEVDSIKLVIDYKKCDQSQEILLALPPSGQRIVNLEFSSLRPLNSSTKFRVYLITGKAKNMNDRISFYEALANKKILLTIISDRIKIKMPIGTSTLK